MARGRSKKRSRDTSAQHPVSLRATVRSVLSLPSLTPSVTELLGLQELHDLRRIPGKLIETPSAYDIIAAVPKKAKHKAKFPTQLQFANEAANLVCVRRKVRAQVLHAKRKTGRAGQRKQRKSRYRDISCR